MLIHVDVDSQLIKRDAIRTSAFRTFGYGAEKYTTTYDIEYTSRDRQQDPDRGGRAFTISRMILRDRVALHTSVPHLKQDLEKHFYRHEVKGAQGSFRISRFQFDSVWLDTIPEHLAEEWCNLHEGLPNAASNCNKFDIMTWLSTLAYAKTTDMNALQTLVLFYRTKAFASLRVPTATEFNLPRGDTFSLTEIRLLVSDAAKSYDSSTEAELPKQDSETEQQHLSRIQSLFKTRQVHAADDFLSALQLQWPVSTPVPPTSTKFWTYHDSWTLIPKIRDKFKSWWDNREFLKYLDSVSDITRRQLVREIPSPHYFFVSPIKYRGLDDQIRQFSPKNIFELESLSSLQDCELYLGN